MIALMLVSAAFALQGTDTSRAYIVAQARAATVGYQNRADAMRAGYRRIGPETPEMGEHWVNPSILMDDRIDYARPSVLTYTVIAGQPTLSGVAYSTALDGRDVAPPLPAGVQWHEHTQGIEEELARGIRHGEAGPSPRLAMVHVWVWLDNPAGMFVEENWALPFARLGLPIPASFDVAAARAVSLLTSGEAYYRDLIMRAMAEQSGDGLTAIISETRASVAEIVKRASNTGLDARGLDDLAAAWKLMVHRIDVALPADKRVVVLGFLGSHHM